METFKQALNSKVANKVAKVQWLGGEYPPFMYRANDLILVSEGI